MLRAALVADSEPSDRMLCLFSGAMNDLAILATGVYGNPLPSQNGAPLRLVVPWKYGFKSIKGIVKIDLVAEQPTSLWMAPRRASTDSTPT